MIKKGVSSDPKIERAILREARRLVKSEILKTEEKKYSYQDNFAQSMTSTGTLVQITQVNQGQTDTTRIGDRIRVGKMECRFSARCAGAVGGSTEINDCRVTIVQWHDVAAAGGINPVDIYQLAGSFSRCNFDHDNMMANRFKVLYDKRFSLNGYSAAGLSWDVRISPNKIRREIQFAAASATTSDNVIFLLYTSDSTAVTHPQLDYFFYWEFTDA